MAESIIRIGTITRVHLTNPDPEEISQLAETYDLHELIQEDLVELNTQDKIDIYDDNIALVIHFPKYQTSNNRYLLNEFNIVLGKDYIISVTRYVTTHITNLRRQFIDDIDQFKKDDEHFKITPYFMLYEIMDVMYDKLNRMLVKITKDGLQIEEDIFQQRYNSQVISNLLIKKRNLSFLKHNFVTQKEVIQELTETLPKFYEEDLEVYFDDLLSKHSKIVHTIDDLTENINSLAETYNSLMTIRTNDMILILTIVTIILGTMTLIAGIFGMNVKLPYDHHPWAFRGIMIGLVILGVVQYVLLKGVIHKK
ncbi:MAG TPA: CorA family divalent cation transporter [Candidatus Absconditabacterales bacterium]|nr:CorA family divalent cation transporter [Candidatus Absconditabacterales bacterium]HNG96993.1 CorA family divalent cation transporter [Candidatus Absconditabacterales bacterium]